MQLQFDRGTIRILDLPAGLDPSALPGVVFDPRVGGYRAPAYRYRDLRRALDRHGAPWIGPPVQGLDGPWRPPDLRPYQEEALAAWEGAGRRGLIALPTGSGKTFVALAAAARLGVPTLVLVPTRVLLGQWVRRLEAFYDGPVGRLGDGERALEAVTCSTFESAYRLMDHIGDRFGLLIVDEAHHFGVGVRDEALEMCLAEARLGLTATPPLSAAERLAELIGPVVCERTIGQLAGRFLAPFDLLTLTVELDPDERAAYERHRATFRAVYRDYAQRHPGGDWSGFVRFAGGSRLGRAALAAWRRSRRAVAFPRAKARLLGELLERHTDGRTLIFTADNATAYDVARRHLLMPITCDIRRREREEALARFEAGELRALVSSRVLNEGLDIPDADTAIILGGTMGGREHMQRIGRLLRPGEGKRARIYELVVRDTLEVAQARRRGERLAS